MKKTVLILFAFILTSSLTTFGQKLKSGNWEISIDKWVKKEKGMFGETQIIFEGVINLKRGKTNMKPKLFSYNENTGVMNIKDASNKAILPILNYNKEDKTINYNYVNGKIYKGEVIESNKAKDIVLYGTLEWLNYKE